MFSEGQLQYLKVNASLPINTTQTSYQPISQMYESTKPAK